MESVNSISVFTLNNIARDFVFIFIVLTVYLTLSAKGDRPSVSGKSS